MIPVIDTVASLRQLVAEWRSQGARVAFVPTMGHLHAGHLRLVEQARFIADRIIVSVFVNPTQFNDANDFGRYPRTLDADRRSLATAACDAIFAPAVAELYPFGQQQAVQMIVPGLAEGLCGDYRPGHFAGVATVVCRLLNIVIPDDAFFGEKDLQQLRVIERLVADLQMSVNIYGVETVRERDGLAMSSRNAYLDTRARQQAPTLFAVLAGVRQGFLAGEAIEKLENEGRQRLADAGFRTEYLEVRCWSDLGLPRQGEALVVLAAAWLGEARLIDNLRLTLPESQDS